MSVGPLGNTAGLSGSQNDAASTIRRARADQKSEKAEGLGATDAEQETSDRDADGRRIWEITEQPDSESGDADHEPGSQQCQAKDPSGNSGGLLDLTG